LQLKLTYCLQQSPDFYTIQKRAREELGTELQYRRIDVRDTELLHSIIEAIANAEGRMDGLVAAAGIQQETPALEYTAQDANRMFEVNITGVMMTAQAVAKQMIRFGNGGSIALIASMSGTIANRVSSSYLRGPSSAHPGSLPRFGALSLPVSGDRSLTFPRIGSHLFCLQR
jgi:NAD(P)-dependent dehydrogenase (short-subunit alcohol dehydrogenase family)